jgi:uncharacterized membrane protein
MASHWNAAGEVNGYMPKLFGLFLMPAIAACILALFIVLPSIDPLSKNIKIKSFRNRFDVFIFLLMLFLFYINLLSIAFNLGIVFNLTQAIIPAISLLLFYAGVLMEHSQRNWFIGVRTPWTMSNDRVWEKTNRICGDLMKAGAVASLIIGIIMPNIAIFVILALVIAFVVFSVIYSYLEYNKTKRAKGRVKKRAKAR